MMFGIKKLQIPKFLFTKYFAIILLLFAYAAVGDLLNTSAKHALIAISVGIKQSLLWFIPIAAMFFIAHTICSFEKHALAFILLILICEGISNYLVVWYAYLCSALGTPFIPSLSAVRPDNTFQQVFNVGFAPPKWWSATIFIPLGAALGLLYGLLNNYINCKLYYSLISQCRQYVQAVITRFFGPLIPILILGYVIMLDERDVIDQSLKDYFYLSIFYVAILAIYVFALFLLSCNFSIKKTLRNISNLFPAFVVGFTSSCSISTMPTTIECTKKNLKEPSLAESIIPATTNIQQIADCMLQGLLCAFLYYQFNGLLPSTSLWAIFTIHFVIARYTTTAILGGAIFIMIPIYEQYLHLSAEAISIILLVNVILDPLVTSCNVLANSAMCVIFEKVWALYRSILKKLSISSRLLSFTSFKG